MGIPWLNKLIEGFYRQSEHLLLEGLMLNLKLQQFGHLMWRAYSLEKTLMLRKIEGKRRKGGQRMWWLDGITYSMDMSLSKLLESLAVHGVAKSWTWLSDWNELNWYHLGSYCFLEERVCVSWDGDWFHLGGGF